VITGNPDGSTAVDYTVNAAVGLPWVTGPEGWDGPVNHVLPAWDVITGQMVTTAIVAAELHRVKTGEGQLATISLMDVALSTVSRLGLIAEAQLEPEPRGRFGNDVYGSYGHDFVTADRRHIIVIALTTRQWSSLLTATGMEADAHTIEQRLGVDLTMEGGRFQARHEIRELLARWIGARALSEVAAVFDGHHVLWDRYQTLKQLVTEDERCTPSNPLLREIEQPGVGRYLRAASPVVFGRFTRREPAVSPTMGQHTTEVLTSWLGLEQDRIAELEAAGVIGG
jgi:2-methylfumaryl-CoA isomerase